MRQLIVRLLDRCIAKLVEKCVFCGQHAEPIYHCGRNGALVCGECLKRANKRVNAIAMMCQCADTDI